MLKMFSRWWIIFFFCTLISNPRAPVLKTNLTIKRGRWLQALSQAIKKLKYNKIKMRHQHPTWNRPRMYKATCFADEIVKIHPPPHSLSDKWMFACAWKLSLRAPSPSPYQSHRIVIYLLGGEGLIWQQESDCRAARMAGKPAQRRRFWGRGLYIKEIGVIGHVSRVKRSLHWWPSASGELIKRLDVFLRCFMASWLTLWTAEQWSSLSQLLCSLFFLYNDQQSSGMVWGSSFCASVCLAPPCSPPPLCSPWPD